MWSLSSPPLTPTSASTNGPRLQLPIPRSPQHPQPPSRAAASMNRYRRKTRSASPEPARAAPASAGVSKAPSSSTTPPKDAVHVHAAATATSTAVVASSASPQAAAVGSTAAKAAGLAAVAPGSLMAVMSRDAGVVGEGQISQQQMTAKGGTTPHSHVSAAVRPATAPSNPPSTPSKPCSIPITTQTTATTTTTTPRNPRRPLDTPHEQSSPVAAPSSSSPPPRPSSQTAPVHHHAPATPNPSSESKSSLHQKARSSNMGPFKSSFSYSSSYSSSSSSSSASSSPAHSPSIASNDKAKAAAPALLPSAPLSSAAAFTDHASSTAPIPPSRLHATGAPVTHGQSASRSQPQDQQIQGQAQKVSNQSQQQTQAQIQAPDLLQPAAVDAAAPNPPPAATPPATAPASPSIGPKILSRHFFDCSTTDIITLVSSMLQELVILNDALPFDAQHLTRFHSRSHPPISIRDYLIRITKFCSLEKSIILSIIYYIDLLCTTFNIFNINSLTVHRFLITAAMVASKGLCDTFCTNTHYAKVGGLSRVELNSLEIEFLIRVDYRIVPQVERLDQYFERMVMRMGDKYQFKLASPARLIVSASGSGNSSASGNSSGVKVAGNTQIHANPAQVAAPAVAKVAPKPATRLARAVSFSPARAEAQGAPNFHDQPLAASTSSSTGSLTSPNNPSYFASNPSQSSSLSPSSSSSLEQYPEDSISPDVPRPGSVSSNKQDSGSGSSSLSSAVTSTFSERGDGGQHRSSNGSQSSIILPSEVSVRERRSGISSGLKRPSVDEDSAASKITQEQQLNNKHPFNSRPRSQEIDRRTGLLNGNDNEDNDHINDNTSDYIKPTDTYMADESAAAGSASRPPSGGQNGFEEADEDEDDLIDDDSDSSWFEN